MIVPSFPIFKYPESHSEGGSRSERTVIHLSTPDKHVSADSRYWGVFPAGGVRRQTKTCSKGTTTRLRTDFFLSFFYVKDVTTIK